MSRQFVKSMKRQWRESQDSAGSRSGPPSLAREAAAALLARSISFGHGRLAVIRLAMAAQAGAEIAPCHWSYCEQVAQNSNDAQLRLLYVAAADQARMQSTSQTE